MTLRNELKLYGQLRVYEVHKCVCCAVCFVCKMLSSLLVTPVM